MNTRFLLLAEYEKATIPLKEVCEKYFNCSERTAINKAKAGTLEVPAFQVGSQKTEWLVHIDDLAEMIDNRRAAAKKEWLGSEHAA
jgi:hypothetical protein